MQSTLNFVKEKVEASASIGAKGSRILLKRRAVEGLDARGGRDKEKITCRGMEMKIILEIGERQRREKEKATRETFFDDGKSKNSTPQRYSLHFLLKAKSLKNKHRTYSTALLFFIHSPHPP